MPRTIKYHLDENVNGAIADGLRRRGINVTTSPEAGLIGAEDLNQLQYALQELRVFFTHDEDFLVIHAAGERHAGIAFCSQGSETIGGIIRGLELLWDVYEADEMFGVLEFL